MVEVKREMRIRIVAVQVCMSCGNEAKSFTDEGLCGPCEVARRKAINAAVPMERLRPTRRRKR